MNFNGLRNCFELSSLRASTQNSDRHFKIHLNFYMSPNIRNSAVYPSYENKYTALFLFIKFFIKVYTTDAQPSIRADVRSIPEYNSLYYPDE